MVDIKISNANERGADRKTESVYIETAQVEGDNSEIGQFANDLKTYLQQEDQIERR